MSETITLPRSGAPALIEKDEARIWEVRTTTCNVLLGYSTDREQAIRNADEDAIKIRAALLPADARERVARWFWVRKSLPDSWDSCPEGLERQWEQGKKWCLEDADAVLAALGGKP